MSPIKFVKILIISLLIHLQFTGQAQKAQLDTTQIYVGDQIKLTFSINPKIGKEIIFPQLDDKITDGIEIIERYPTDTSAYGELVQSYTITSFEDSVFNISPFSFVVDNDTLKTNPLILKVGYLQPDSAMIARIDTTQAIPLLDIKNQEDTPWSFAEFWFLYGTLVLIAAGISVIISLVIFLLKKRKKNMPTDEKPIPKIPPHIIATEKLAELKAKNLWQQDKYKEYHTELTEILRQYLELQFSIPAMEYTADEILQSVRRAPMNKDAKLLLDNIFPLADLVKFAKLKPLAHENDLALQQAYEFIRLTKPADDASAESDNQTPPGNSSDK